MNAPTPGETRIRRQAVKRSGSELRPAAKPVTTRPRGYIADYNPQPRTLALLDNVKAVLEEYREHWPLTVRQVYYRLVGAFQYEKSDAFYERLCNHMSNARRGGLIPFEAIRDDGVSVVEYESFADKDAFFEAMNGLARKYKRDKRVRQAKHVEVWCEAAGMQPQLARVASRYSIPVYSSSGFDSTTAKYDLSQRICIGWKTAVILHLGDFDPSGVTLFNAVTEDVRAFVLADRLTPMVDVEFERVALTADQVEMLGLVRNDVKLSSHSVAWPYDYSCQLEALAPDQVAALLDGAIRRHLDLDILAEDIELERHERRELVYSLPAPGVTSHE